MAFIMETALTVIELGVPIAQPMLKAFWIGAAGAVLLTMLPLPIPVSFKCGSRRRGRGRDSLAPPTTFAHGRPRCSEH
jgi:hypothetical protein